MMKKYEIVTNARTPTFRINSRVNLEEADLHFLKSIANDSGFFVARFLLHDNDHSLLHQMIICKNKSYQEKWLRQTKTSIKTYEILEGECDLVFRDSIKDVTHLKRGDRFSFKPECWHKFNICSEWLIFREEIPGPLEVSKAEYL